MNLEMVLSEVERWPVEDRLRLVREVWDRLVDQGHEPELSEELKAELDRRIEAMDHDPGAGVPWEVVKARALERFHG